jgi:hypothetical protein
MSLSPLAPRPNITFTSSTPRVTPTPPRAARFGDVLSSTVMRSAESAVQTIPGAPAMAFALRGGIAPPAMPRHVTSALVSAQPQSSVPAATPTSPAAGPAPISSPGLGGEPGAITSSLQQSQDMNLYYLQIQESVNAQNRTFTALSNVMKAEHDTVKTAISNLR